MKYRITVYSMIMFKYFINKPFSCVDVNSLSDLTGHRNFLFLFSCLTDENKTVSDIWILSAIVCSIHPFMSC